LTYGHLLSGQAWGGHEYSTAPHASSTSALWPWQPGPYQTVWRVISAQPDCPINGRVELPTWSRTSYWV